MTTILTPGETMDVETDGPSADASARTHELRREYFSVPPSLSVSPSSRSPSSLSLCTDANETTAGLRDIYVRFSRTLLLARRAFVDVDRIDVPSLLLLSLSLTLAPAPQSLFALTRERRDPSPRFFALSPSLSLTRRWPRLYTCARDRVNTRRESETAEPLRDCLLSCRIHAHTLSVFLPVCVRMYVHTPHVHVRVPRGLLVRVFNRLHISRGEKVAYRLVYRSSPTI